MLRADSEVTLPMEDLSVAHGFFISNYLQGRGRSAKRPTIIPLEVDLDVRLHRTAWGLHPVAPASQENLGRPSSAAVRIRRRVARIHRARRTKRVVRSEAETESRSYVNGLVVADIVRQIQVATLASGR